MTEKAAADRVLELDEKATPGPWCKSGTDCKEEPTEAYIRAISDEMTATVYCAYDADFISEVRTLAPALARQVKELEADLHKERANSTLEDMRVKTAFGLLKTAVCPHCEADNYVGTDDECDWCELRRNAVMGFIND